MVSAVFFDTVYGYELKSLDDQFFTDIITMNENVTESMMPSIASFLVNVFPCLQYIPEWVPGAGWKKKARQWREQKDRTIDGVYNWTKQRVINGVDDYSIISSTIKDALQTGHNQTETEKLAKNFGAALLVGGSGLDPIAYRPLKLDQSFRAPHTCTQDDEYQGYRIPKGAIIIGNIWAITQDKEFYEAPETFNPDRFLDPSVPVPPVFGWGMRTCPGRHFFQDLFFIQAVLILATFKIGRYIDENGEEVEPLWKIAVVSAAARPSTFKLKLSIRSTQRAELVQMTP
ncbi:unnamed protein product [Rhizoctonia solani]|uniref:O-methylsterigmatocystin oxidoreductase n=1 Tax=Rhizoctonia solani TaxID=456999 RepID=A0A8H3HW90_9AGAM|nr:unnamed protein product [Rhizoctonia solani]